MTSKELPEGTTSFTYYGTGSGKATNQLKKVTAFSGFTEEYSYDNYGLVNSKKEKIDNVTYTSNLTNDKYGRTTAINYPSGYGVKYNYDANGYLTAIKNSDQSVTLFTNQDMNGYNQYKRYKLGNNKTSYQYFNYGIPTRYYSYNVQDLRLHWNYSSGNLTQRYDRYKGKREYFQYDNLNRLKKSYGSGLQSINIHYATNGNINFKTDVGSYSYHNTKINAVANVTNSQNNVATGTQYISYTSFHQPKDLSEGNYDLEYTYGGDEQRIKSVLKQNNSTINTRYYFDGFEKDVSGSTTQWLHYISAGENTVAIVKRIGNVETYYYTYTDHLGSIVRVTNGSGSTVSEQNFDAWGRKRNPSDWSYSSIPSTPSWLYRGYTMHESMPEFKLVNMNGRMYDPLVGRMLSVDNYVHEGAGLQGYNRYSYALNNPMSYVDPDGELPFLAIVAIGAAVGVFSNGLSNASVGRGFFDGWVGAAAWGGIGAAASFGIGTAAGGIFGQGASFGKAAFQFGAHGLSNGLQSFFQGGSFGQGFLSGGIGSGISSGIHALGGGAGGQIFGGGLGGAIGSAISGGDFFQGFTQGVIVGGFNHALHSGASALEHDPPGAERMIEELQKMSAEERAQFYSESFDLWSYVAEGAGYLFDAITGSSGEGMAFSMLLRGGGKKILQKGGQTLSKRTLKKLGLTKQQGRDAIHALKRENGLPKNFHGRITSDGHYLHPNKNINYGRIYDFLN